MSGSNIHKERAEGEFQCSRHRSASLKPSGSHFKLPGPSLVFPGLGSLPHTSRGRNHGNPRHLAFLAIYDSTLRARKTPAGRLKQKTAIVVMKQNAQPGSALRSHSQLKIPSSNRLQMASPTNPRQSAAHAHPQTLPVRRLSQTTQRTPPYPPKPPLDALLFPNVSPI